MLRTIGGAVLGYVAMMLVVFCGLTAAYVLMGADRVFNPGVYDVSVLWMVVSVAVSLIAAFLGGWTARAIARSPNGPRVLAGIVVVLGIAIAVTTIGAAPAGGAVRADAVGPMEAMQYARTPLWMLLLNPVIGAVGALIGGRALRTAPEPATPAPDHAMR